MTDSKTAKADVKKKLSEEEFEIMLNAFTLREEDVKKASVKKEKKLMGRSPGAMQPGRPAEAKKRIPFAGKTR